MKVRNCKTENTYDVQMELCTEVEESALIFDLSFQFVIFHLLISTQLHHLFFDQCPYALLQYSLR
jgi:hypothetical protein